MLPCVILTGSLCFLKGVALNVVADSQHSYEVCAASGEVCELRVVSGEARHKQHIPLHSFTLGIDVPVGHLTMSTHKPSKHTQSKLQNKICKSSQFSQKK